MVVNYFDVFDTGVCPYEAYAPLIIDPDRMLAFSIALKSFKSISRRGSQVIESGSTVQDRQFTNGRPHDV
ncbi:HigB toxin protein (plasmid) [Sinorhizobium americanum CCGM7]|nr:HigB toxin protein [Sinorhizobium americanum CCGM7]